MQRYTNAKENAPGKSGALAGEHKFPDLNQLTPYLDKIWELRRVIPNPDTYPELMAKQNALNKKPMG